MIYCQNQYPASLVPIVFLLLLFAWLHMVFIPSKTKRYRISLTDLYVAGKIRQLADKDKIDISEEFEAFKSWTKKRRIEEQALDETIEKEIQEKIWDGEKGMKEIS